MGHDPKFVAIGSLGNDLLFVTIGSLGHALDFVTIGNLGNATKFVNIGNLGNCFDIAKSANSFERGISAGGDGGKKPQSLAILARLSCLLS